MNDLQIAADLRDAANYMRKHGWIASTWELNGARCLVRGVTPDFNPNTHVDSERLAIRLNALGFESPLFSELKSREMAVDVTQAVMWNDTPGRTAEQVIDRLESTALALEVRHLAMEGAGPTREISDTALRGQESDHSLEVATPVPSMVGV